MPFFIIIGKLIKNKIFKYDLYLSIDSEYIMIISKFEIFLIFSPFSPLIVPLIICILKWNELFYSFIIYKLKWKIKFSYNNNLPVAYLYIALAIQHILSFLFLFYYQHAFNQYFQTIASIIFLSVIILCYVSLIMGCRIYTQYQQNQNHAEKDCDIDRDSTVLSQVEETHERS
eukprot:416577_1